MNAGGPSFPPGYPGKARRSLSPCAIVGMAVGGCAILFFGVIGMGAALVLPLLNRDRRTVRPFTCEANLKQLSGGLVMYTQDYDERLPPARAWEDGLAPYTRSPALLVCPIDRIGMESYAFNKTLDRRWMSNVPNPAATPGLFESSLHRHNGTDLLQSWDTRHSGPLANLSYLDGHIGSLTSPPNATDGLPTGESNGSK